MHWKFLAAFNLCFYLFIYLSIFFLEGDFIEEKVSGRRY